MGSDSIQVNINGCLHNCGLQSQANPNRMPAFIITTPSPFDYHIDVYDNLGQFVQESRGSLDAAQWNALKGEADTLSVLLTLVPVSDDGQHFATGAFILKAMITTRRVTLGSVTSPKQVNATRRTFVNRCPYIRGAP